MKKVEIKKLVGASALSLGLVVGVAGFAGASTGTIDTTGPDSDNEIRHESRVELDLRNDNEVDLRNRTTQRATSGDARVRSNTTAGNAASGDATNESVVDALVEVDNSSAAGDLSGLVGGQGSDTGRIENTGPNSENEVTFENRVEVDIENDNEIDIDNTVDQRARSGDASVRYNTTGGSASTGSASNSSSSIFTVSITN
jgi:hypothetical protein